MTTFKNDLKDTRDKVVDSVLKLHNGEILLRHYGTNEEIKKRKHIERIEDLDKYIDFLNKIDEKSESKDLISKIKKLFLDNQFEELEAEMNKYEYENAKEIEGAIKCANCKCISCANNCPFNACYYCTSNSKVIACDKCNNCITDSKKKEELYVHEFEKDCVFNVVGKLTNIENESQKEYMYLQDEKDSSNEQLVGYRLSITGIESFISLTEEELDKIYQIFLDLKVGN